MYLSVKDVMSGDITYELMDDDQINIPNLPNGTYLISHRDTPVEPDPNDYKFNDAFLYIPTSELTQPTIGVWNSNQLINITDSSESRNITLEWLKLPNYQSIDRWREYVNIISGNRSTNFKINYEILTIVDDDVSSSTKYTKGLLLPDGKVLMIPYGVTYFNLFDPDTNTCTKIPCVGYPGATPMFRTAILLPTNDILAISGNNAYHLSIVYNDDNTYKHIIVINTIEIVEIVQTTEGSYPMYGKVQALLLLPTGKIYLVSTHFHTVYNPTDYSQPISFREYDPITMNISNTIITTGSNYDSPSDLTSVQLLPPLLSSDFYIIGYTPEHYYESGAYIPYVWSIHFPDMIPREEDLYGDGNHTSVHYEWKLNSRIIPPTLYMEFVKGLRKDDIDAGFNIFDSASRSVTKITTNNLDSNSYIASKLTPDGRILCIPTSNAKNSILLFDYLENTFTTIGLVSGDQPFLDAVILPSGKILLIPYGYRSSVIISAPYDDYGRTPSLDCCLSQYVNNAGNP